MPVPIGHSGSFVEVAEAPVEPVPAAADTTMGQVGPCPVQMPVPIGTRRSFVEVPVELIDPASLQPAAANTTFLVELGPQIAGGAHGAPIAARCSQMPTPIGTHSSVKVPMELVEEGVSVPAEANMTILASATTGQLGPQTAAATQPIGRRSTFVEVRANPESSSHPPSAAGSTSWRW